MAELTILILAAGPDDGWEGPFPKQLCPVAGEPLLLRILRELGERGFQAITVTNKPELEALDIAYFRPEHTRTIWDTILSTQSLWHSRVLVLVGDLVFSPENYDTLLNYQGSTPMMFDSFALLFDEKDYNHIVASLRTLSQAVERDLFNYLWRDGFVPVIQCDAHLDFDIWPYYQDFLEKNPWAR